MLIDMSGLLKADFKWTWIINDIAKDINEFLEDKSNQNTKFHKL